MSPQKNVLKKMWNKIHVYFRTMRRWYCLRNNDAFFTSGMKAFRTLSFFMIIDNASRISLKFTCWYHNYSSPILRQLNWMYWTTIFTSLFVDLFSNFIYENPVFVKFCTIPIMMTGLNLHTILTSRTWGNVRVYYPVY